MTTRVASVVIVTKNRKEHLRIAVRSALAQLPTPEIIIIDDGSTDGTPQMMGQDFPGVTFIHHDESRDVLVRRNEGARLATGDIMFTIDDDGEFMSADTITRTLVEFDHPRIAAIAIPMVEPLKNPRVMQRAPDHSQRWVTDCYVGTAHAMRRDVFLQVGGYRESVGGHQGEERDLCMRLLAAGYVVRLGSAESPIHHYESPIRDHQRVNYFGRRNDVLFAWHYVPMPWLMTHLAGTVINAIRTAMRVGRWSAALRGTLSGLTDGLKRSERAPISPALYRLHRKLKKQGPLPLDAVVAELPPLPSPQAGR